MAVGLLRGEEYKFGGFPVARYIGPVCKLCRRDGEKLFLKGDRCYSDKCSVERRPYGPGMHGKKRKKVSDYSLHLKEKQKVRAIYSMLEGPFKRAFVKAERMRGNTGEQFLCLLERRLDNVIYKMGFANSRIEARLMIRHKHVLKNGRRADIPSMLVKKDDMIELKQRSKEKQHFKDNVEAGKRREMPAWIEVDREKMSAKVVSLPKREDITYQVNERLIIELYSK